VRVEKENSFRQPRKPMKNPKKPTHHEVFGEPKTQQLTKTLGLPADRTNLNSMNSFTLNE
jgi:hypothetical protein